MRSQKNLKSFKTKLKKNDIVTVISGKEKGKRGKIIEINPKKERIIVEGVNIIKKTIKKSQENPKGGIITKEAGVHISNVKLYHPGTDRGYRLGVRIEAGKKNTIFTKGKGKCR